MPEGAFPFSDLAEKICSTNAGPEPDEMQKKVDQHVRFEKRRIKYGDSKTWKNRDSDK